MEQPVRVRRVVLREHKDFSDYSSVAVVGLLAFPFVLVFVALFFPAMWLIVAWQKIRELLG